MMGDLTGFQIIKDMTDDDLREEIFARQRNFLKKQPRDYLLRLVVQMRISDYQQSVMGEAGIQDGPFNFFSVPE